MIGLLGMGGIIRGDSLSAGLGFPLSSDQTVILLVGTVDPEIILSNSVLLQRQFIDP